MKGLARLTGIILLALAVLLALAACFADQPSSLDSSLPAGSTTGPSTVPVGPESDRSTPTGGLIDVVAVADSYGRFDDLGARFNSLPHMEWLAYCAEAFGFETTIASIPGSPASLTAHVTEAQRERWRQVDSTCTEEAVRRGWVIAQSLTPDELRAEYRYLLQVNECLTGLGYGTEVPSEDAFVEGTEWEVYANTPFGSMVSVAPEAADELPPEVRQQLEIQHQCSGY